MAYSYGKRWTDEIIIDSIKNVMEKLDIKHFPTHSEMDEAMCNTSLSNKVSKTGGTSVWSARLNLSLKDCETNRGLKMEEYCYDQISGMDMQCELMQPRYPYDLTVNKHIKIDVKAGYMYEGPQGNFFTFNLEKSNPTCDIYVAYCMNRDNTISKTYIIPSKIMQGKTQLSLGEFKSKYDKYIDNWDLLEIYDKFYEEL